MPSPRRHAATAATLLLLTALAGCGSGGEVTLPTALPSGSFERPTPSLSLPSERPEPVPPDGDGHAGAHQVAERDAPEPTEAPTSEAPTSEAAHGVAHSDEDALPGRDLHPALESGGRHVHEAGGVAHAHRVRDAHEVRGRRRPPRPPRRPIPRPQSPSDSPTPTSASPTDSSSASATESASASASPDGSEDEHPAAVAWPGCRGGGRRRAGTGSAAAGRKKKAWDERLAVEQAQGQWVVTELVPALTNPATPPADGGPALGHRSAHPGPARGQPGRAAWPTPRMRRARRRPRRSPPPSPRCAPRPRRTSRWSGPPVPTPRPWPRPLPPCRRHAAQLTAALGNTA